jgi:hypothetical protein
MRMNGLYSSFYKMQFKEQNGLEISDYANLAALKNHLLSKDVPKYQERPF